MSDDMARKEGDTSHKESFELVATAKIIPGLNCKKQIQ